MDYITWQNVTVVTVSYVSQQYIKDDVFRLVARASDPNFLQSLAENPIYIFNMEVYPKEDPIHNHFFLMTLDLLFLPLLALFLGLAALAGLALWVFWALGFDPLFLAPPCFLAGLLGVAALAGEAWLVLAAGASAAGAGVAAGAWVVLALGVLAALALGALAGLVALALVALGLEAEVFLGLLALWDYNK